MNKAANGAGATNPFRLDRSQAATADQDHDYTPEQQAFHGGLMDLFPLSPARRDRRRAGQATKGLVMGYYDGNTVTALWNYAQHFAMSDNSFGTTFGPSTPGAINLISGQTNGIADQSNASGDAVDDGDGGYTLIGDPDPLGDVCSSTTSEQVQYERTQYRRPAERGLTWGLFQGGFDLTDTNRQRHARAASAHIADVTGTKKADYIPHHQPFQYYARPPTRTTCGRRRCAAIGQTRPGQPPVRHARLLRRAQAGNLPAVSFLKARATRTATPATPIRWTSRRSS